MQGSVRELLTREWEANGYRVRTVAGRRYGSRLLAAPRDRRRGHPRQLLVGHLDTVWPPDTTRTMPVELRHGRLHGPGTFDMKAGLVLMIHAVRALRDLELTAPADPVAFVVADEEVGSPESRRDTERLARVSQRAFVLEPPMGEDGALKTARKGVARFTVHIQGRASHAGLAPEEGVSAVAELADVVQALHGLTDPARGVSVNVGVVEGGTRPNVVAAEATARVDVRVLTRRDGERVMAAIRGLAPSRPGIRLTVEGGMQHGPLEPTPANRRLWQRARSLADALGFSLRETTAGGASDGNLTSMHTPTLDGLGAVGDGAHAVHEHVLVDSLPRRAALLAGLLLSPLPPGDAG
jgi:glutamate carboxypeptidase